MSRTGTYSAENPVSRQFHRLFTAQNLTRLVLIMCMLFCSGGIFLLLGKGTSMVDPDSESAQSSNRAMWLAAYPLILAALFTGWRVLASALNNQLIIVLMLALSLVSALWSHSAGGTVFATIQLAITTLFAVYAPRALGYRNFLETMGWSFVIMIGLSLVFAVALPHYGFVQDTQNAGSLRGIFPQKNTLATYMTLAIPTVSLLAFSSIGYMRLMWAGTAGLALIMLLMTKSATALLLVLAMPFLVWFTLSIARSRANGLFVVGLTIFGFGALAAAIYILGPLILEALGKDAGLSGRDSLWATILASFTTRPLFGFGFFGFWTDTSEFGGARITSGVVWHPTSTHNAWLNMAIQLGVPGLLLMIALWVTGFMRSGRLIFLVGSPLAAWPFVVLIVMTTWSLVQSNFMNHQSVLHMYVIFAVTAATEGVRNAHVLRPVRL
ncbi:MAG: O-antigen ligase family protein [Rhodobiaceae bacterium]|nr:O-antigen ligase family protein [Rhodobiaceae bacterium]